MCHHQGAVNTISDLNERYGVGRDDCVLGLSSLSFDLSVWDIFGVLGWGGRVVLVGSDVGVDPDMWSTAVIEEGVTLWNTVPQFMELLVTGTGGVPPSLRLVFMSGDRIPPTLPKRIVENASAGIRVIAMGGATEAA